MENKELKARLNVLNERCLNCVSPYSDTGCKDKDCQLMQRMDLIRQKLQNSITREE